MTAAIVPLDTSHFDSLHAALDAVAREKRFLAFLQAPPKEAAFAFYRNILDKGHVQYIALVDGQVAGWCDVLPTLGEARQHVGTLGIALLPSARHQGIGRRLLEAAIGAAWKKGFTRIELSVRCDNSNAIALYELVGFLHEGIKRHAFRVDGAYHDAHAMALLHDGA